MHTADGSNSSVLYEAFWGFEVPLFVPTRAARGLWAMGHCRSVDRRRGRGGHVALICFVFVGVWTKPTSFVSKAWLSSSSRTINLACRQQAPEHASCAGSRSELYQLLQQREHVLRRPDMYIGPVEPRNETAWIVKGRQIVESTLLLSPGLLVLFSNAKLCHAKHSNSKIADGMAMEPPRKKVRSLKIETVAVHGGDQHDPGHGAIFPPITTATSFVQPNLGEEGRFAYSRNAYETAIAELEGGCWATATASGMAATALALELLQPQSHVLAMRGLYGGTVRLFEKVRTSSQHLSFTYLDLNDLKNVCSKIQENTRMIWVETPTNPLLTLVDIGQLVEAVRAAQELRDVSSVCGPMEDAPARARAQPELLGADPKKPPILICADNTFATAWNQRPLKLGVDIVMISASKYIGGHSDMTGGALVTGNNDLAQRLNALAKSVGAIASPFEAYLALRGMKTLAVRMERQCSNAQKVAEFLVKHENVTEVHYPGLASHPQHALCRRQMRSGGAVVTVRLKGKDESDDLEVMRRFFSRLKIWVLAESLGGVEAWTAAGDHQWINLGQQLAEESMINHSASMSHGSMSKEERAEVGVYDTTLRLSVGIEDMDGLKAVDEQDINLPAAATPDFPETKD
eukprot:s1219_g8.t1